MTVLDWNEALMLDRGVMDQTHREFVILLNRLAEATPDEVLPALDAFIAHSELHFAEEERWMQECAFPPLHCHRTQHQMVLETAREVRNRAAEGRTELGDMLARAVAEWFRDHVATMDYVLDQYMGEAGYTPAVGVLSAGDSDNAAHDQHACGSCN
jgi:hemerythrin-like metal-binding protein